MNRWYERLWYNRQPFYKAMFPFNLLFYLLIPSLLYQLLMSLRRWCYLMGVLRVTTLPVPVIVVGNLTVGGTGKTPCVIALAKWLCDQGMRPGIVSRGYKATVRKFPASVNADSCATTYGDEPVLIAKRSGCPVIVDPDRVRGAQALMTEAECNIIIADDGLQHYRLGRDIEILVIDGQRRFGNEYCLPAGPLRESMSRIASVNFVVVTGEGQFGEYQQRYALGDLVNIQCPDQRMAVSEINTPVHAVAGIGNPHSFFDQLQKLGLNIQPHIFPDHANYWQQDLHFHDNLPIIMTEKDAVKCRQFAEDNWWFMPITAILPAEFYSALATHLLQMQSITGKKAAI